MPLPFLLALILFASPLPSSLIPSRSLDSYNPSKVQLTHLTYPKTRNAYVSTTYPRLGGADAPYYAKNAGGLGKDRACSAAGARLARVAALRRGVRFGGRSPDVPGNAPALVQ